MKKWLVVLLALFYEITLFWMVSILENLFQIGTDPYSGIYTWNSDGLYLLCLALTLPLIIFSVFRPAAEFLDRIDLSHMTRELNILLLSSGLYFLMMTMLNSSGRRLIGSWIAFSVLFLMLTLNQILVYWLVLKESLRRYRESEKDRFHQIQHLQYERIASEIETTRRLRHDLRHHLHVLGTLNAQDKKEEITRYLSQYSTIYEPSGLEFCHEDPIVSSLLEYYLSQARQQQVQVHCQAALPSPDWMEPSDMTVLLGNVLENALEAMERLDPGQEQSLSVEIAPVQDSLLVRIVNTCTPDRNMEEPEGWRAFQSSKPDTDHGIGLQSVDSIARKYRGSAQFQQSHGLFTTRIILNPPKKP